MQGILGVKVGMTQVFGEDGSAHAATVIKAGPCLVVQRKTTDKDGYEAVQLGLVEDRPMRRINQPMSGHFKKAGVAPSRRLVEFQVEAEDEWKPGDQIQADIFSVDDFVDVIATSKGKGFQGVIKRHGFGGGRATHGSMFHRAPGSIGQSAYPSRVFPGVRLPGRMGGKRVSVKNLRVLKVDADQNLLYLEGAIPGPKNGYVAVRRAKKG